MTDTLLQLNAAQLATVLAALRFYQEKGQGDPANRSDAIHDIATGMAGTPWDAGAECISLDADAIDALCEGINGGALVIGDAARAVEGGAFTVITYKGNDADEAEAWHVTASDPQRAISAVAESPAMLADYPESWLAVAVLPGHVTAALLYA